MLICPSCKTQLRREDKCYKCSGNHVYDRAKSGYVNLLLSNQKNAKDPGDTKEMCVAREKFLNPDGKDGYYESLKNTICNIILKYTESREKITLLDGGCGEGYYTNSIYNELYNRNRNFKLIGVDISKHAVNIASRKNKQIDYAVASVFHLPIADKSCDIFVNIFSPFCKEEILRVLSRKQNKKGYLVMAIPDRKHLYSLKELLYDNAYENEVKDFELEGFELLESVPVKFTIELKSTEDIKSLFGMTPYFWRTPKESVKRLDDITNLVIQCEFYVLVYQVK